MTVPHITITDKQWQQARDDREVCGGEWLAIANKAIEIALAEQDKKEVQEIGRKIFSAKSTQQSQEQPKKGSYYNPTTFIDKEKARESQEQYITVSQARKIGWDNVEYFNELTNAWHTVPIHIIGDEKVKLRAIKQSKPVEPHAELKANLVKLDGKLVTREAAIALWESKKDTCDVWYRTAQTNWLTGFGKEFSLTSDGDLVEYELRERPLKQIEWTGSREDVIALLIEKGLL